LVDELVRRFLNDFEDKYIAVISVDPSKRKSGGALLGDRIRMNAINHSRVYMRSLATRQSNLALSRYVQDALDIVKAANYHLIILETSGIGQSDTEIIEHSSAPPDFLFEGSTEITAMYLSSKSFKNLRTNSSTNEDLPVFGTIASQFNDPGTNQLYRCIIEIITSKTEANFVSSFQVSDEMSEKVHIIPPNRTRYLSEISENNRQYDRWVDQQQQTSQDLYAVKTTIDSLKASAGSSSVLESLEKHYQGLLTNLDPKNFEIIENWPEKVKRYKQEAFVFQVRGKEVSIQTQVKSLSHTSIPKISLPRYKAWGDLLRWNLQENVPGSFPYTAGVYPFKREGEDPTRMFAGEGGPERTNQRFHYLSQQMPAKRLSTAFDSVTLYGSERNFTPDSIWLTPRLQLA
jgi:methylmalonyl-CoA mutase